MYDFSKQKEMLAVTLDLLSQNNLLEISSLGGGTALAGFYLKNLLENICASYEISYQLSDDEYILIENEVYRSLD